jgi:hypothetical protein
MASTEKAVPAEGETSAGVSSVEVEGTVKTETAERNDCRGVGATALPRTANCTKLTVMLATPL